MKDTFIYELWYYYHSDALKLLAASLMVCVAPITSHMGFNVVSIALLIISTFTLLYCLLKHSKLIGMFKGIIFYILIMGVFIWCFSNIYSVHGIINDGVVFHDTPSVLYFSIVTWTTLGYGDFQPTESVRLWASAQALTGYVFTGILVGLIISAFTPVSVRNQVSPKRPAKKYNET